MIKWRNRLCNKCCLFQCSRDDECEYSCRIRPHVQCINCKQQIYNIKEDYKNE